MEMGTGTITRLRERLAKESGAGSAIVNLTRAALSRANGSGNRNTYLWRNEAWTLSEAERAAAMPASTGGRFGDGRPELWGIPVSVKDCFDLEGAPTTSGTRFYGERNGRAQRDAWLVERLRAAGAVITGKTHLHPLAYGITGENADFGDCVQPGDAGALTGGSSSGAAASVLEGSALAAIGTDTGGSVRVPAALCGLAGYRATLGRGDWRGGAHLAESFDTFGWLFRDLEDGPLLGSIFGPTDAAGLRLPQRFGVVGESFLGDCAPQVLASLRQCQRELEALGLTAATVELDADSRQIFTGIQASEAARIHAGNFGEFEKSIRERLKWGAELNELTLAALRQAHAGFRARMDDLLADCELLLLPAAPIARLTAGADHNQTRSRLLRYTTPVSLAGLPAVTIPFVGSTEGGRPTGGMQLAAAREDDARLLAIASALGAARRKSA